MPNSKLTKERNPKKLKLNRLQSVSSSFHSNSLDESFSNYKFPSYTSKLQSPLDSPVPLSPTSTFGLFPFPITVTESASDFLLVEDLGNPITFPSEPQEDENQLGFIPSAGVSYYDDHDWIVRLGFNISKIGDSRKVSTSKNTGEGRIENWREERQILSNYETFDPLDLRGINRGDIDINREGKFHEGIFSRKSSLVVFHDSFEYDTTTQSSTSSPSSSNNRKLSVSSSLLTGGTFSGPYSPTAGRQDSLRSSSFGSYSFSPITPLSSLPRDMRSSIVSNTEDDDDYSEDYEIDEDLKSLKVFSIIRKLFVNRSENLNSRLNDEEQIDVN